MSDCLRDDELAELVDGALKPEARSRLEAHACASCRALLVAAAQGAPRPRRKVSARAGKVAAVALISIAAADASAQVLAGPVFRVNQYATGFQMNASVAAQPNGSFVVTWDSPQDGSAMGVFARLFDAAGYVGPEFQVNTFIAGAQAYPAAGANAAGDFVVAWRSDYQDGSGSGIFARRYDAAGTPIGPEFQVNTFTPGIQNRPAIAVKPSGTFVVAWEGDDGSSRGVFAQRFDAGGFPLGGEIRVNTYATGDQHSADVAVDLAGDFVVVWKDFGPAHMGVFAQRYDAGGQPVGGEFVVNTIPASALVSPKVAKAPNGDIVVAWERDLYSPPIPPFPPDRYYIATQRFTSAGVPIGTEYTVPSTDAAGPPDVGMDALGRSILVWSSGGLGLFGLRFDVAGQPMGAEFPVTPPGIGGLRPSMDVRSAIAWEAGDGLGTRDIFARRFDTLVQSALAVDAVAWAGSNGNGVLEPGESFPVDPAWSNTAAATATFGGLASNFSGPGAPGNPVYSIVDGTADYGPIPGGGAGGCRDAVPNCYVLFLTVAAPRPASHWDAGFDETLTPLAQHGGTARWTLHVGDSFTDVPRTSSFYRFVETLLHRGVTGGCDGSSYCPASSTTREQMAVFALAGKDGAGHVPPACTSPTMFTDVPATSPFCPWIEELARRGVVSGCGPGSYCPLEPVSREQMAVFALRTLDPALVPPACGPPNMFLDVPETSGFCRWIEELALRGVVTGCGGGNYCPTSSVTRDQMAVFIGVTFGLTLYGP